MKKFFKNFYLLLIFLFLYAPIVVLMIFSFNDSKSRRLWNGFTTRWYVELFRDATFSFTVCHIPLPLQLLRLPPSASTTWAAEPRLAYLTVNNIPMSSSDTIMGVTFMLPAIRSGQDRDPYPRARYVLRHRSCSMSAQAAPAG